MAGGFAYQFQGSTIQFATSFLPESPVAAITGITKANPAVITLNTTPVEGAVYRIAGVVGMTEMNGKTVVAINVVGLTFEAADLNSTAYGTYVSGGTVTTADFDTLCELTGYSRQGVAPTEIETTDQCSTAKEKVYGLSDYGTIQVDYKWAPQTTVQLALEAAQRSHDTIGIKVTLPDSGGIRIILGTVLQTSEQAQVNGLWTASMTVSVNGAPVDLEA